MTFPCVNPIQLGPSPFKLSPQALYTTQWCRTKSRSKKIYHWRFIHRWKRMCGTFQKQLTKKYGTGIFWRKVQKSDFCAFLAPFSGFGSFLQLFLLFLVKNQQTRKENTNIRHAVQPWGIFLTCRAQKEPFCLKWRLTGRKASK